MFNFLHKLAYSLYFTKASVNYIQPKSLNLHFKSDVDNKYLWLNLEQYHWIEPHVEQISENNNNFFMLKLKVQHVNSDISELSVAKFETRREAESALKVFTTKMYSPEKSLIKFLLVVLALFFIWGVIVDITYATGHKMAVGSAYNNPQANTQNAAPIVNNSAPTNNTNAANLVNLPNTMTPEQQAKIMEEIQKQAQQMQAPPLAPIADVPETPQNPAVKSMIDSLGTK